MNAWEFETTDIMVQSIRRNKEADRRFEDAVIDGYEQTGLFDLALNIAKVWSKQGDYVYDGTRFATVTFALGIGAINALSVELHLAKEDGIIRDIGPIIEELKDTPALEFLKDEEDGDLRAKTWHFSAKGVDEIQHETSEYTKSKLRFMVRAWIELSMKCRLVGTGEFKETMKIVCEE